MSAVVIGSPKNEWARALLAEARPFLQKHFPKKRIALLVGTAAQLAGTLPARMLLYRTIWLVDDEGAKALRPIALGAHAILAPNQSLEAAYLRLGIPSKKISVAYPPVRAQDEKRKTSIQSGALAIACDGSIETEEGLGIFFRAAILARDIIGDVRLIIGGEPKDARRLSWLVKTMGLSSITQIIPTPRLPAEEVGSEWLSRAHIYALPSTAPASVPRSLAAAQVAGCAIVATDQLSHREFIKPNKNGVLVPPGNADMLSQAIINLARNPEWMRELGNNSSSFAREHFSRERFEQTLGSLLA